MIVDARGDAVNRADKGALAAADHPKPDPAALIGVAASLDGHARILPGAAKSARSIAFKLSADAPPRASRLSLVRSEVPLRTLPRRNA
jgi:hypothetical protein